MNHTLILLDLEETLIESFEQPFLIMSNLQHIVDIIHAENENSDVCIGLMSWAIWNWSPSEVKIWTEIRQALFNKLSLDIDESNIAFEFSQDEWVAMFWNHLRLRMTREEIPQIFKKEDVLFKLRNHKLFDQFDKIMLIDDTVEHGLTISRKDDKILAFVNIKEL